MLLCHAMSLHGLEEPAGKRTVILGDCISYHNGFEVLQLHILLLPCSGTDCLCTQQVLGNLPYYKVFTLVRLAEQVSSANASGRFWPIVQLQSIQLGSNGCCRWKKV